MAKRSSKNTLNNATGSIVRGHSGRGKKGTPKLQGKATNSPGYKGGKFGTNRGGGGGTTKTSSFKGTGFKPGGQKFGGGGTRGIGGTNRGGAGGSRSTGGHGSALPAKVNRFATNRGAGKGRNATGFKAVTKSTILPRGKRRGG